MIIEDSTFMEMIDVKLKFDNIKDVTDIYYLKDVPELVKEFIDRSISLEKINVSCFKGGKPLLGLKRLSEEFHIKWKRTAYLVQFYDLCDYIIMGILTNNPLFYISILDKIHYVTDDSLHFFYDGLWRSAEIDWNGNIYHDTIWTKYLADASNSLIGDDVSNIQEYIIRTI